MLVFVQGPLCVLRILFLTLGERQGMQIPTVSICIYNYISTLGQTSTSLRRYTHTHTHTHTDIYIYIYIYIYKSDTHNRSLSG